MGELEADDVPVERHRALEVADVEMGLEQGVWRRQLQRQAVAPWAIGPDGI